MTENALGSGIIEVINQHWEAYACPVLLSRIGLLLLSPAKAELDATRHNLKSFIIENLGEDVRYINSDKYGDLACPIESSASITDAELIKRFETRRQMMPQKNSVRKYKSQIWNSFITPLEEKKRYIIVSEDGFIRIANDSSQASPNAKAYEIVEDDLAFNPDGSRVTFAEARSRIEKWIDKHQINLDLLYEPLPPPVQKEQKSHSSEIIAAAPSKDLHKLVNFLSAFTDEELKRLSFPGDIIYKLIRDK